MRYLTRVSTMVRDGPNWVNKALRNKQTENAHSCKYGAGLILDFCAAL